MDYYDTIERGPWGNSIHWPCPGEYSATLRAKLYRFRPFDRTWQDGSKAKRIFSPWRRQWLLAEQASHRFGAEPIERAQELFQRLPLAPLTFYDSSRTQGMPVPLPPLTAQRPDRQTLSTYADIVLAHITHAWASLGEGVVALRMGERTIAAYTMVQPTCQLAVYVNAYVAAGGAALEVSKLDQWWIPPGAGWRGWKDEKWNGEVAATDLSSQHMRWFLHGFFEGLVATNGGQVGPSPSQVPSYRISAGTNAATNLGGAIPEGGESTDLMLLLAARHNFLERCAAMQQGRGQPLTPAHIITKDGWPIFGGLDGTLNAATQGLLASLHQAVSTARVQMEETLRLRGEADALHGAEVGQGLAGRTGAAHAELNGERVVVVNTTDHEPNLPTPSWSISQRVPIFAELERTVNRTVHGLFDFLHDRLATAQHRLEEALQLQASRQAQRTRSTLPDSERTPPR